MDGWADLIEGMGDKAEEVRNKVFESFANRNIPEVGYAKQVGHVGLASLDRRTYLITKTSPGATTAIQISKQGNDLYASWRTFLKPGLNIWLLIILIIIASLFAWFNFNSWFSITIVAFLAECLILAIVGKLMKNDSFAYFFIQPTLFDSDDITTMSLAVHKSILRSLNSSGIDISKLRLKQSFKGGRKGEDV